jgi:hypothetical protein
MSNTNTTELQITESDRQFLLQEVQLKLEQTPATTNLQPEYQALLSGLQSLHTASERAYLSKLQVELLRNIISAGSLQISAYANAIRVADESISETGHLLVRVT